MMKRAYSTFEVKNIDEDQRTITGIATTPTPDRMEDIVVPEGAKFTLPIPLLWQHDSRQPIGCVTRAKVSDKGIEILAKFVKIDEPGKLKERLDEAWQSVKAGLVRGLSIGFRPIGEPEPIKGTWGLRFDAWEWLELSAVTIPANADASITSIKSADALHLRAATGAQQVRSVRIDTPAPGATGKIASKAKGNSVMTYKEQIAALEATRAAKAAAVDALQKKVSETGSTKDAAQKEEFDGLMSDINGLDSELKDLRDLEKLNLETARPCPTQ